MLKSPGRLGRLGNAIMGRLSSAAGAAAAALTAYVGVGGAVLKKTSNTLSVGVGGAVIGNN